MIRCVHLVAAAALAGTALGCATRPPTLPHESWQALPWGAVEGDAYDTAQDVRVSGASAAALPVDRDAQGRPHHAVLVLSGGGANGAFGAGLLTGWTLHGTRPRFRIVTGVSTGALMAVYAFLGPKYDAELERFYTRTSDADVLTKRSMLSAAFQDSLADNAPLKAILARAIDEPLLDEVAREHRDGRRLYVSTTDVNGVRAVVWDMGAIAASGRADRAQRFRDVLLAATSIPVVFPPVYFTLEVDGRVYTQMHVDGGVTANLIFAPFMIDVLQAIEGERWQDPRLDFYIVINGHLRPRPQRAPVAPNLMSVALASNRITSWAAQSSLVVRLYRIVRAAGWDFRLAGVPPDYEDELPSASFVPQRMTRLFDYAHARAAEGYPWLDHPLAADPRELVPE